MYTVYIFMSDIEYYTTLYLFIWEHIALPNKRCHCEECSSSGMFSTKRLERAIIVALS